MKIEILSELENPLLKRKQFEVKVIHDAAFMMRLLPALRRLGRRYQFQRKLAREW
jgi:ribosomal protein S24E